jgi:hypothetical protein
MPTAQHIDNVFTSEDLSLILKILTKIPNQKHNQSGMHTTNGFTEKDPIYSIIKKAVIDPINQRLDRPMGKLTTGMQLITKNPLKIHTDFNDKGDSGYGTAFLIPLYQDTKTTNKSYTIIFDQCWKKTQNINDYIATNPEKPKHNADYIWEDHCDHNPREWMEYLSVKLMAPWEPGSVITWDRQLFHTSDNFLKKGIFEKSALVLFTSTEPNMV